MAKLDQLNEFREALAPFVRLMQAPGSDLKPDDEVIQAVGDVTLTWSDLRHAGEMYKKCVFESGFPSNDEIRLRVFNTGRKDHPWEWEVLDRHGFILMKSNTPFQSQGVAQKAAWDSIERKRIDINSTTNVFKTDAHFVAAFYFEEDCNLHEEKVHILMRYDGTLRREWITNELPALIKKIEVSQLYSSGLSHEFASWVIVDDNDEFHAVNIKENSISLSSAMDLNMYIVALNKRSILAMDKLKASPKRPAFR